MSITFSTSFRNGPEVNMANGNAARLLDLLGYDAQEGWGEAPAEDFLGRTLLAQGLLDITTDDEQGRPTVEDGRFIYCGTAPGYLAGRLTELREVAIWAYHHHTTVAWG
ncbi:hypothetical protein ABT352_33105 [Streptosporangium sp. NPDC000563]|uniref:hypothetical protein n=1 Tax=Streptosporangium sp. NPDC000563 TaxID=3154366 RepID=UPI0033296E4C